MLSVLLIIVLVSGTLAISAVCTYFGYQKYRSRTLHQKRQNLDIELGNLSPSHSNSQTRDGVDLYRPGPSNYRFDPSQPAQPLQLSSSSRSVAPTGSVAPTWETETAATHTNLGDSYDRTSPYESLDPYPHGQENPKLLAFEGEKRNGSKKKGKMAVGRKSVDKDGFVEVDLNSGYGGEDRKGETHGVGSEKRDSARREAMGRLEGKL